MKRLLPVLLLSIFLIPSLVIAKGHFQHDSVENDIQIVKDFILDLSDESVATDVILSQYLIVSKPTDELYDYLEASLEEVRLNLMLKNIDEIAYINYHQMSKKDIKDIDTEGIPTQDMYFLYYKKRQMLAVYVENNKIGSFTLVSKGGNKAHFVRY